MATVTISLLSGLARPVSPPPSLFLAVTLLGLYLGTRHHHEPWALILGGFSTLAIAVVFLGLVPSHVVAYVGMTGLVVASILNVWLRTRQLSSR